jgi:hypothetical protein
VIEKIGTRFRREVEEFAARNDVPVIRFAKGDRKLEVMRPHLERQAATGRSGVAAIGVAQEFQTVVTATTPPVSAGRTSAVQLRPGRASGGLLLLLPVGRRLRVDVHQDLRLLPLSGKVWLNGHEWAKRQASRLGVAFTALSNGFLSLRAGRCCRRSATGSGQARSGVFLECWWARLPLPLTAKDWAGGYWGDCSMRQVEVSRTLVFDQPRSGRAFFEALVADNLDLGRPDTKELIFGRQVRSTTTGVLAIRGVDVTINAFYKHSRIKQYFKEGRRCASRQ